MKASHKAELKRIYDPLNKKISNTRNSIIEKLVKEGVASRTKPIFETISHTIAKREIATELEEMGYIVRHQKKYHEYSITALGIWEYEKSREKTNEKKLMSIIHDKYFQADTRSIGDLERIILASLLFNRIFSDENKIHLDRKNNEYISKWYQIVLDVMNILYDSKFITKKEQTFVDHPDKTYLFVRNNYLPSQSNGIYFRGSDGTHYLDILNANGAIDKKKLEAIYTFIFGEQIEDPSQYENIKIHLRSFARKNGFKLSSQNPFKNQKTTKVLTNTFELKYLLY